MLKDQSFLLKPFLDIITTTTSENPPHQQISCLSLLSLKKDPPMPVMGTSLVIYPSALQLVMASVKGDLTKGLRLIEDKEGDDSILLP